jgi:Animal haem peroxidase
MTAYRSIDGTGNNQNFNATATDMTRVGDAHFVDGISEPIETVNPRTISNNVVGEGDANVPNPDGLSAFMYSWGQFIDHDLDLVTSDGVNHIDIPVLAGDPVFPDASSIPLTRSVIDPATGAGTNTPATAVNQITGWLDASMVYGSTQAVTDSLRLPDGHMKTSNGGNLPISADGAMMAGDVRAQENPGLTALQTLFVREHNYQVDQLKAQHSDWTGEHLYQEARAIVGAEISHITYDEFLPKLLGPNLLTAYHGFDPNADPRITEEFAGAAYRFGHSIVSDDTERVDNFGVSSGEIELSHAFFMPADDFNSLGGADGFLRHLGADPAQTMDARIVDGLRNFLFDPPVKMDLAAINIQRGHDLGLGTLNETREALHLTPYATFEQLTDDPHTLAALKATFASIDQVDLWTGGLSEHHMAGAMLGETFGTIIAHQFAALRDGDQFYYERALDPTELAMVKSTSLSDIIERDTSTDVMQADAFLTAERHASNVAAEDPNAPQLVIGTAGHANIRGGSADDTLVANNGASLMLGGGGDDTFVFEFNKNTVAVVRDFHSGSDTLEIHGVSPGTDFSDLHITSRGALTSVDIGHDHIQLVGVSHVSASDFLFHV